jgi:hypothetical protein
LGTLGAPQTLDAFTLIHKKTPQKRGFFHQKPNKGYCFGASAGAVGAAASGRTITVSGAAGAAGAGVISIVAVGGVAGASAAGAGVACFVSVAFFSPQAVIAKAQNVASIAANKVYFISFLVR